MLISSTQAQNSKHSDIALNGSNSGPFVQVKSLDWNGTRPHLTVGEKFGSLSLPLYTAPEIGKPSLELVKTNKFQLSLSKTFLGESIFFLGPTIHKSIGLAISRLFEKIQIRDPLFWLQQGNALNIDEGVKIDGIVFSKRQCYLKAISLNKELDSAWIRLALSLKQNETIEIDGEIYDQKKICIKAVLLGPVEPDSASADSASAWHNLGLALGYRPGLGYGLHDSTIINNVQVTAKDCFERALEFNPASDISWYALGLLLSENETAEVKEKYYSKNDCFLQAVHLDIHYDQYWTRVGQTMPKGQETVTINGEAYTAQACLLHAIALNTQVGLPYLYLAQTLGDGETIAVNGKALTARDCYITALEKASSLPTAWNNLGAQLLPGETVIINGEIFTEQDCYKKALALSPNHKNALDNARFVAPTSPLQDTEVISIDTIPKSTTTLRQRYVSGGAH